MKNIALLMLCGLGTFPVLLGQTKGTQRLSPLEAKTHIGEAATVCGKVVATRISKYAVGQHGKPITFDLDVPEPSPVFFFVTWSSDPAKVEQTKAAYEGKQVCVTGTITKMGTVPAHIVVTEPSHIEIEADDKK